MVAVRNPNECGGDKYPCAVCLNSILARIGTLVGHHQGIKHTIKGDTNSVDPLQVTLESLPYVLWIRDIRGMTRQQIASSMAATLRSLAEEMESVAQQAGK